MTKTWYLKNRDTKPKLITKLINPDGTVHDNTGITDVDLHIKLQSGTVLSRNMTIESPPTSGDVGYSWQATDWDAGGLIPGAHQMEYESVAERLTFPNDGYHILKITADIGQGAGPMEFISVPGQPFRYPTTVVGDPGGGAFSSSRIDAATEKVAFTFVATKTGTLNRVGFRFGTVTQAPVNGLRVSFQDLNASGNPDGVADQTRTVGVGAIVSNTWIETGLITSDGTDGGTKRSVQAGEIVACVIEFISFVAGDNVDIAVRLLGVSLFAGPRNGYGDSSQIFTASWVVTSDQAPNFAVQYSDGTWAPIAATAFSAFTSNSVGSGSSPDEYGVDIFVPVSMKCGGIDWALINNPGGTKAGFTLTLYDTDKLTVLASQTFDGDLSPGSGQPVLARARWDDVTLSGSGVYAISLKPSTVSAITIATYTLPSAAYQSALFGSDYLGRTRTDGGAWTTSATVVPVGGSLLITAIAP